MTINYRDNNFKEVDRKGDFALLLNFPRWKRGKCSRNAVFYNKNSGEEVGREINLCVKLFDENFNRLNEPVFEEDCYGVKPVREEIGNE